MEINWPVLFDMMAKFAVLGLIIHAAWHIDRLRERVAALEQAQTFAPTPPDSP